jgi:hypothetical protein
MRLPIRTDRHTDIGEQYQGLAGEIDTLARVDVDKIDNRLISLNNMPNKDRHEKKIDTRSAPIDTRIDTLILPAPRF